jgi:lipid-binding SYLF domain-containing protein
MHRVALAAIVALGLAVKSPVDLTSSEAARLATAARVAQDIRATIPSEYWDQARCVVVVPDLTKAAFAAGGEYGDGVMSCRAGDGWTAPVFMQLAKGSWNFQAGAEQADVVLLVMNESGVQKLLQEEVALGTDASVATGPIGRDDASVSDAAVKAEVLSYSRVQGLFAGTDLSGSVLRPAVGANHDAYGETATPRTILAMRGLSAPTQATAFLDALGAPAAPQSAVASSRPSFSASTVSSHQPSSPNAAPPAADSDMRARVVALQQLIDRLIADAEATPVGTSGASAASADTLVVSRERLMQLRRQLDAILAAMYKQGRH